jgi:predicted RNase H-like nuclease
VAVALTDDGYGGAWFDAELAALLRRVPDAKVVAVDMPLGLLEVGWRLADSDARSRLKRHSSRVFSVPPRTVWEDSVDAADANRRCKELTGNGMSAQAWGLARKLAEARACWGKDDRLVEIHPEVSFWAMAGQAPISESKKSWAGQTARRALLAQVGIVLPDDLGEVGVVPPDDILDAAAAAWSAQRILAGRARSLPDPPELDGHGRPVAIWY